MSTGGPGDERGELQSVRGERRAARRRRNLWLCGGIAVVLIVGGVGALLLTDALRIGSSSPALAERPIATTSTSTSLPEDPACRAPLTPDAPLRLWIGGDSLAGSLGPSLGEQTAATRVVAPVFDSRVSSGLTSKDFFDWPEHATQQLPFLDPEIVVFIIGANDWQFVTSQPLDSTGEPAWKAQYATLVDEMLDVLEGDGSRPVYWVGAPTMQDKRKDIGVVQVNEVARKVVERHDDATYVDAYRLFSGTDGKYSATLPGANGKNVRVRAADGVHLTPEGGDLLAERVFELLDARCKLDDQAVAGQPQPVREVEGSSQIPGTSRGGTGTRSPTVTTRPSATLPPATSPPPTASPTSPPPSMITIPSLIPNGQSATRGSP